MAAKLGNYRKGIRITTWRSCSIRDAIGREIGSCVEIAGYSSWICPSLMNPQDRNRVECSSVAFIPEHIRDQNGEELW